MVWYNRFDLFEKSDIIGDVTLYCDNPGCDNPLSGEQVLYDSQKREVYHSRNCLIISGLEASAKSREIKISNFETISLVNAEKLFRKGGLSQTKGLEEKTD